MRQLKRKTGRAPATLLTTAAGGGGDSSALCSWRHSLCAGFKSSRCRDAAEDRWVDAPPPEPPRLPSTWSSVAVSVVPSPSRSQSVPPRSLRSSLIAPLRRLLSSRSLGSTSDADTLDRGSRRPATREPPSTHAETTSIDRRCASLERGRSRPTQQQQQQRSISRTASLNRHAGSASSSELRTRATSVTSSPVTSCASAGARRQVDVEVGGRPWSRQPAAVRLRPRPRRSTDDVDRYQSSSGSLPFALALF